MNRRAKIAGADGRVTADELLALVVRSESRCWWCTTKVNFDLPKSDQPPMGSATLDHLVPLARGGSGHITNLVVACFACNRIRSLIQDRQSPFTHARNYARSTARHLEPFEKMLLAEETMAA